MIDRLPIHNMDLRSQAKWIWLPGFNDADQELPGRFVLFRKTLELPEAPLNPCEIRVSADTRYRLFVNGKSVAFGPCKSYPTRWYYETIDISPFLRAGVNVITAKVLRFFPGQVGSSSLAKANVPGFIIWGNINETPLVTDESWLCREDRSIRLQPRSEWNYILGPPFLSLDERVDLSQSEPRWQDEQVNLAGWKTAVSAVSPIKMMPAMEPWKLYERPIPILPEIPQNFQGALKCTGSQSLQGWNDLIAKQVPLRIDAGSTVTVEFESSTLTTGFLEFDFTGGNGAELSILYAESYERDLGVDKAPFPRPRFKADRRDWENGRLYGNEDFITISTSGDEEVRYEPFWFRTFRFIRLQIACKDMPLTMRRIGFRETCYPLEITTSISLAEEQKPIWDICVNTLRYCMHETYEDCPFYEQNQFAMDARLQMLFTYQLSRDDRLARKTIHEFHASQRDDGLLETNSPVSFRAINIPQFSLFWILMLHDHMMYFEDAALIRKYIGTADGILNHFDALVNEDGLVGAFDPECWAFIDWVKQWHGAKGIRDMAVPPIYKKTGVAAYNSLLYSWVLQHAADLCNFIGRNDTASEYRYRSNSLNKSVRKHCYNGTFFVDGPGASEISEHTQIFAILSGAISDDESTQLMHRTISHDDNIPRCSYSMKHYVFRALSKTGLYDEYFATMMRPWGQMVKDNLTTCAEDDVGFRSDCHGWSASPIYEFVAEVFGVKPRGGRPGSNKAVEVVPRRELLLGKKTDAGLRWRGPGGGELNIRWDDEGGEVVVIKSDETAAVLDR